MEYPVGLSTVGCVGVVGFILTLKGQVFSLILYNMVLILIWIWDWSSLSVYYYIFQLC